MGQVAMTVLSLREAVERTGTTKVDIWRAIQAGTLSAKKTDDGGFAIDATDLLAVFETNQADQCSAAEDAVPSVEASGSPGPSATSETTATSDVTAAFAVLGTEPKGLLELPAQPPASDELRTVDLAERNAQLAEPAPMLARVEKMAGYPGLADERGKPWWRRLVGWMQMRRGRAARKRLRERL
jgi:hypothetical protein